MGRVRGGRGEDEVMMMMMMTMMIMLDTWSDGQCGDQRDGEGSMEESTAGTMTMMALMIVIMIETPLPLYASPPSSQVASCGMQTTSPPHLSE
jgi:hypothetical protein